MATTWNVTIPTGATQDISATLAGLDRPDPQTDPELYHAASRILEGVEFMAGSGIVGEAEELCNGTLGYDLTTKTVTIELQGVES